MKSLRILASFVAVFATASYAGGFRLEGHSARAIGMSAAMTAFADDSSAIYYNPAGLSGREGLEAQAGISLIAPSLTFERGATGNRTSAESTLSTPFNAYAAVGFTEELSLGVGVFVPFGSSASWPKDWEGAGRALTSSVQVFDINPTLAWQVHPRFRVGAGFQAFIGNVYIERGLNFVDSRGQVQLGGSAHGFGWNVGIQLELVEDTLMLGASYRSGAAMPFTGRAHFVDVPVEFQSLLKDQPISADITLPDVASVGLGLKVTKRFRLALDVTAVTWETFRELRIEFEDPALTNPLPKRWDSMASVALGAEYDIGDSWQGRMGVSYDPAGSPADTLTPDLPDLTRFRFSAGGGWKSDFGLFVDLGYQFVFLVPATSTAPGFGGTYSGHAHVVGLNLGYRL